LGSEPRNSLSPEARGVVQGLLAGKSLDELAPPGSVVRAEVEAHIVASLEWATHSPKKSSTRGAASAAKRSRNVAPAPPAAAGYATAYSDGASRGNPGPAAIGVRILDAEGAEVFAEGRRIGSATNNVAEYHGAIAALEKARDLGLAKLELRMDSELVVRQLEGRYRVKEPSLIALKAEIDGLLTHFRSVRVRHVPRAENHLADELANEALDGPLDGPA
jgi:ribonuclease HI